MGRWKGVSDWVARERVGIAGLWRATEPLPRLSRWGWLADGILAAVLAVLAVSGALNCDNSVMFRSARGMPQPVAAPLAPLPSLPPFPDGGQWVLHRCAGAEPWQLVLAVFTGLPLVARRRYPLTAFWLVIGASLIYHQTPGFDPVATFIASLIAAYSAAMYSRYRGFAIVSVALGAGLVVADQDQSVPSINPGFVAFLLLVPAGLVANTIHTWKQRVRTLETEREAATRLAVDQERARIAHELHDVVTHNVSVMVVQAGAARKVMDTSPEQAREALLAIESGGRAAMTELRHVMGLLTMAGELAGELDGELAGELDGGAASAEQGPSAAAVLASRLFTPQPFASQELSLAPQPGLDQVPALAARIRATGVVVELTVTGEVLLLSPGIELAAYRVVQEALTNTVKHAVGARVKIAIDYAPDAVRVEVADTGGTAAASARSGARRGLVGLRERLAMYGGTLETEKHVIGGYRVRAVIPLEGLG